VTFDPNQALQQGLALHRAGRLAEAEGLYRQILAVEPDHADSLHLVGVIAQQNGRHDIALDLIGRAIARNDRVALFHCNMGVVLRSLGRLDDAVAHFDRALALDPRHYESLNNLGYALKDQGKLEEAARRLRQALALRPNYAEAHNNLGTVLLAQNRAKEAAAHYRHALDIRPQYPDAHFNLGTALFSERKLDEAAVQFNRVIALKPDHAAAHFSLGAVNAYANRFDAALAQCEKAIALKPDDAAVHHNLGLIFNQLGRPERACQCFERAIALSPRKGAYHRSLAEAKRFDAADDARLFAMERLARDEASLTEKDRIALDFALAKAYADLGEHERSFRHLLSGNTRKRKTLHYDPASALARLERIRSVFDGELMRSAARHGNPSSTPVFIVGMPRSGTSLIEQILASHPLVFGAGELYAFEDAVAELADGKDGMPFPELVRVLPRRALRELGARYLATVKTLAPPAARVTDKMPGNFRFAGLIHLALPNARIIHVRRDPVDTCLSLFSHLFVEDAVFYCYDLGELGRHYRAYEALMEHWRKVLPVGVMLEVQYEDVVADLEAQTRRLLAHCGLDWDARCLAFYKAERTVRTASAAQVRRPIYRSSVGRWRPDQMSLQPLLDALGIASRR
jgi:tetratricopeptide (TPR) repeat protein